MSQHRGHSRPPRGHCTPDSLHGRERTGAHPRRSVGDRTDGKYPHIGRTQAYSLCTFSHGCTPDTSLGNACTPPPWPRASQSRFPGTLPGAGQGLLHKTGSWWHFLYMFCKGIYSVHMCHLLHRSPQGTWCSTCLRGGREGILAESGTFRKDWLLSKRRNPLYSSHSCHFSLRATCLGDRQRRRPAPTDMSLSDMKNTGLQIHCRFYKKNDKAGILSKCLF